MSATEKSGILLEQGNLTELQKSAIPQLSSNIQAQSSVLYYSIVPSESFQGGITIKGLIPVPVDLRTDSGPQQTVFLFVLEREFKELADQWYRETRMLSFARQKAMHPAYQKIIGMGWNALPLILREVRDRGGDWLWALEAIARKDNPAKGMTNFKDAVAAWLAWGTDNLYIA